MTIEQQGSQITRQDDYEKKEFLRQYLKDLREEALTTGEGREFQRGTTLTKMKIY